MAIRILILTSEYLPLKGGIGTYAREMANAATGLGAVVTVVAPNYEGVDVDTSSPFELIRFEGGRHSIRNVAAKIKLVKNILRERKFDIVHAVDWPFFIPLRLARSDGQRIITLHGTEINELANSYKRHVVKKLGLFEGWATIVTNSEFTRSLLFQRFEVRNKTHVQVELLGASAFWSESARPGSTTRSDLNIAGGKIVLLTVGRLTERKGQLTVVQALRRLPPEQADRFCYLVVGPAYDEAFRKRLEEAACGLDVRLIPAASDEFVRDIYAASDLFCLVGGPDESGRVEGFGLVLLEAAAQGLPILASATGGVPEVVRDGVSGILVPPNDQTKTGDMIVALARAPRWRQRLGEGARLLAEELTWHRCAKATYRI